MKDKFLILAMVLFVSCSSEVKKTQSNDVLVNDTITSIGNNQIDKESEYLKVRNNYVEYFKKADYSKVSDSLGKLERKALLDLENQLIKILENSRFSGEGKINLETLFQCLGFGMLDGLSLEKDSMRIIYTSKNIFLDYFKEEKISQFDGLTPMNLESIFQNAFYSDSKLSNYSSVCLESSKNIQVYGMVGMHYQMTGPWPPVFLYVFVSKSNYIYLCEKRLEKPIKEIQGCRLIYDSIYQESEKQLELYHSSNMNDTSAFNKHIKLWDKAMVKYCDCYQKELKNDSQFEDIKKQIENIIKFLEQEND